MSKHIQPFRIEVPQEAVDDLQKRLANTRWPDRETVRDWSQGVPLEILTELCEYWDQQYDWRATEHRLNRIPQFRTTIDDVPIHYLHVRSPHSDATRSCSPTAGPGPTTLTPPGSCALHQHRALERS